MKKYLALALFPLTALAQPAAEDTKLDGALRHLLTVHHGLRTTRGTAADTLIRVRDRKVSLTAPIPVTLTVTDGPRVAERIVAAGHSATAITGTFVTARIGIDFLPTLSTWEEVQQVRIARKFSKRMDKARVATGVDKIHNGTNLETPFTGKGVIIGIIDQGFEYRHAAFLTPDGQTSRVRAVWDRSDEKRTTRPTTDIPTGGEKTATHATHVANIAAGSKLPGMAWHGVAPEAELIFIPSTFDEDEVPEDVQYIKEFAEKENKPWVVNMSFGSYIGSHDGLSDYDQAIAALTGKSGFITAAMGNESGQALHTTGTIVKGQPRYMLLNDDNTTEGDVILTIWNQATDHQKHIKTTPFLYYNRRIDERDQAFWDKHILTETEVHHRSGKEVHNYLVHLEDIRKELNLPSVEFGVKVELSAAETRPQTIHAWTTDMYGQFSSTTITGESKNMLRGDDLYLAGEGSASIPTAIAVGSFNSSNSYYSYRAGGERRITGFAVDVLSYFSSTGPSLDTQYPKPTVAAPGALITSAYNKFATGSEDDGLVDINGDNISGFYTLNNTRHYYGLMQGTSMAAPFMAGTLALWLQANPELDHGQVISILRETSTRDEHFTQKSQEFEDFSTDLWNPAFGFGKVNAYDGLKKALQLVTGIGGVNNSSAPLTLLTTPDAWRVLFNTPERFAQIRVFNPAGQLLHSASYDHLAQGQEVILPLRDLPPGAYLINFRTAGSNTTRRVLVK